MNERKSKNLWPKDNVKMAISMGKRRRQVKLASLSSYCECVCMCIGSGVYNDDKRNKYDDDSVWMNKESKVAKKEETGYEIV